MFFLLQSKGKDVYSQRIENQVTLFLHDKFLQRSVCQIYQLSSHLVPVRFLLIFPAPLVTPGRQTPSGRHQGVGRCSVNLFCWHFSILQPVVWMTQGQPGREPARQSPKASAEYSSETLDKTFKWHCELKSEAKRS